MASTEHDVQGILEKIRSLPDSALSELDTFVDFLRFRSGQASQELEPDAALRLIHLRGLLSGYDTSPENLAALRREIWNHLQ
jgi:hypothetical protein